LRRVEPSTGQLGPQSSINEGTTMRARIKFDTNSVTETLVGVLKEKKWFFETSQDQAEILIQEVRDSVEELDLEIFNAAAKIPLFNPATDSRGTLSREHETWVARILNSNIHQLQLACEGLVFELVDNAIANEKEITFDGPIQIVERRRKETIIEGQTLATRKDRWRHARSQHGLEFAIAIGGMVVLAGLLLATFPWGWRNFDSRSQTWMFSMFEKGIGSVAVTTLISGLQFWVFLRALRDYTIRWSIPGRPQQHHVKNRGA
jgi:hypothetical protein